MSNRTAEKLRRQIIDKLVEAKASGLLTENDESLLIQYAQSIIRHRNK